MEHTLSVAAPANEVWQALIDPEKVVSCMPGATLSGVEGESFNGQIKVKIGPVALLYKGTGTFVEKDEAARKVVLEANAKDSRGNGTAKATITMTLAEDGDKTTGTVLTDLAVTGKPAQFGRGMLSDVGGKIIQQFSSCLSDKLSGPAPEPQPAQQPGAETLVSAAAASSAPAAATTGVTGSPPSGAEHPAEASAPKQEEPEALDLMQYAGSSVAKRVAPVAGALAIGALLFVLVRRLRG
jgi:carbon monoxide dehydrogenase subunit G